MKKVTITLTRSLIGRKPNQVKTAHALGLKKLHSAVTKEVSPQIQGMIDTISHLVRVEEV
ncbi:MAG TPA: 50S ribosomal protein L30 [Acholeplasmataceae bacterium]|jgi:large subunit ribosomal protein L30|nr:50S ribosomal protein L30 [Acholeplasmataceae bacterium]